MAVCMLSITVDTVIAIAAVAQDFQGPVQNFQMISAIIKTVISAIFQGTAWYITRRFVESAINPNTKMTLQILCDISLSMFLTSGFALLHAFTNNFLFQCLFAATAAMAVRNYGKPDQHHHID